MNPEDLCMGCMGERAGATCEACGWEEGTEAESPLHLPPRTLLLEQYLLGRVLGQGGFGITYLAWDLNLDLKLAIKEYLPGEFATRAAGNTTVAPYTGKAGESFGLGLNDFLDEARTLARFRDHPNVASVLNFFRANGTGYIVMAYVEGITFKQYIEEIGGRVPYATANAIMMPVMDALREVHGVGLLHRDISPDNIYITRLRQVKVLDFSAARKAATDKSLSVILKPGFAPVEQYLSKGKQGPWTDVYALGATFYRAICGEMPPESLQRQVQDDLQPPSALGADIPPEAEQALLKAMAVRAEDRFQTVRDFQQALLGREVGRDPAPAPAGSGGVGSAPRPAPQSAAELIASFSQPGRPVLRAALAAAVGLLGLLGSLGALGSGMSPAMVQSLPLLALISGAAGLAGLALNGALLFGTWLFWQDDPRGIMLVWRATLGLVALSLAATVANWLATMSMPWYGGLTSGQKFGFLLPAFVSLAFSLVVLGAVIVAFHETAAGAGEWMAAEVRGHVRTARDKAAQLLSARAGA